MRLGASWRTLSFPMLGDEGGGVLWLAGGARDLAF